MTTSDTACKKLEAWLHANPGQSVTLEYDPKGFDRWGGDRKWRAKLGKPIGSKMRWATETFNELVQAIAENRP